MFTELIPGRRYKMKSYEELLSDAIKYGANTHQKRLEDISNKILIIGGEDRIMSTTYNKKCPVYYAKPSCMWIIYPHEAKEEIKVITNIF